MPPWTNVANGSTGLEYVLPVTQVPTRVAPAVAEPGAAGDAETGDVSDPADTGDPECEETAAADEPAVDAGVLDD